MSQSMTNSNANIRFENIQSQPNEEENNDQLFKPARKFKYEVNPYERDLLATKEEQVIQELKFLDDSTQFLQDVIEETDSRIKASDADLDPLQNSNCKWFETAYQTVQAIEEMTETIDEQENTLTQG